MNNKEKLTLMKARLSRMEKSPKNIKSPGVCRALRREVRNLEKASN